MERLRDTWKVSLVEAKAGPYPELAPLAAALGLPFEQGRSMSLLINRTPVQLSLSIHKGRNSEHVDGVSLTATLEGPGGDATSPFLLLRSERGGDVADKGSGISHEVQLGVPEFDEAVYIDSDATEAEVRRVLARETTRDAITWFLAVDSARVKFTSRQVTASLPLPSSGAFDPDRLLLALEAMVLMARSGGPRGEAVPRRGEGFVVGAMVATALAATALFVGDLQWPAGRVFPGWIFLASGAVLAAATARPAGRLVAGDSGSGSRARALTFFLFLFGGACGASAGLAVNGLLGSGEPARLRGSIVRVERGASSGTSWVTTIRWDDGTEQTQRGSFEERVGRQMLRTQQDGAFVPWGETVEYR